MEELLLVFRTNTRSALPYEQRVKRWILAQDPCPLHQLTHSRMGEKANWKAYRLQARVPVRVFHQDEIPDAVRSFLLSYDPELPVVLTRTGKEFAILLSSEELVALRGDTAAFIQRLP